MICICGEDVIEDGEIKGEVIDDNGDEWIVSIKVESKYNTEFDTKLPACALCSIQKAYRFLENKGKELGFDKE